MPPISVGEICLHKSAVLNLRPSFQLNRKKKKNTTITEVLTKILFSTDKIKRILRTHPEFCLHSK